MNPRMDVAIIAVTLLPETQIVREGLAFALEGRHRNTLWQDSRWWRQRALQSYQQVRPFDTGWSHRCAFQGNDRRGGLAYTTNNKFQVRDVGILRICEFASAGILMPSWTGIFGKTCEDELDSLPSCEKIMEGHECSRVVYSGTI